MDNGFPVTDPELDAPDGAVVDGYERHGMTWTPVAESPPVLTLDADPWLDLGGEG